MSTGLGLVPIFIFSVTKQIYLRVVIPFRTCIIYFVTLLDGLNNREEIVIFLPVLFISYPQTDALLTLYFCEFVISSDLL